MNGRAKMSIAAVLAAGCLYAGPAVLAPAAVAQGAGVDVCAPARADWTSVQRSTSPAVLQVYRDGIPSACAVQRALADARLLELRIGPGAVQRGDIARLRYVCTDHSAIRVNYDQTGGAATLSRFGRRTVHLQQTDAPSGQRYVGYGYTLERDGERVTIAHGTNPPLRCAER